MRSLKNKPQVEAPSSDYPYGRIKDDTGLDDGTPINEDVCGDQHQFFETLMSEAGITPNELPDNEYNGFQLMNALKTLINKLIAILIATKANKTQSAWTNITLATGWTALVSGTEAKYRIDEFGRVNLKGSIKTTTSSQNYQWASAGAVPSANTNSRVEIIKYYSPHGGGNPTGPCKVVIEDDGACYVETVPGAPSTTLDCSVSLEGISYWPQGS